MPGFVAEPAIVAALISVIGATIGFLVSIYTARRQLDAQAALKLKELDAQARRQFADLEAKARGEAQQLQALGAQLRAQQEALRQEQLTEILKKRIETYPALYEIISTFGRNWEIEGKRQDYTWAKSFLEALLANNAKNGAFFSEKVYQWYGELRNRLETLARELRDGREATQDEIGRLYDIIRGPIKSAGDAREPGLGSYIKDELGSYVTLIVSALHSPVEGRQP